jgi:hypothetical protein
MPTGPFAIVAAVAFALIAISLVLAAASLIRSFLNPKKLSHEVMEEWKKKHPDGKV